MLFDERENDYVEKAIKDMHDLIEKVARGYDVDKQEILDNSFTLIVGDGELNGLWENLKSINQVKEKREDISVPYVCLEEFEFYEGYDDDYYEDPYGWLLILEGVQGVRMKDVHSRPQISGLFDPKFHFSDTANDFEKS
jgi:hypothetical protein